MFLLLKTAVKFRNLQVSEFVNTHTNRIFQILFQFMCICLRYTYFEKQFLLQGEQKIFLNQQMFFSTLKIFL